jgi:cytochrome b6-f complex iron-sulfur subunit
MSGCTRRQFHRFVAGTAAGLWACGTSSATVAPTGGTVTLSFAQFPALGSPGGSVVVNVQGAFPLAVVRTGDLSAVALSATCTHQFCLMSFDAGRNTLHCPCHDADFDLTTGAVLRGPPPVPVPVYTATVQPDAIVVSLS